jgi:hypothetical protein
MNERVIERCVDVCDAKNEFALCDLRAERYCGLFLGCFGFLGWLEYIQTSTFPSIPFHIADIESSCTMTSTMQDCSPTHHFVGLEDGRVLIRDC